MSSDEDFSTVVLYETEHATKFDEIRASRQDVQFPEGVKGWSDVLDCRVKPYSEKSIEENCEFAKHVRKYYILVNAE